MARRVFFSFHHSIVALRAGQVRNCTAIQDRQDAGFWDAVVARSFFPTFTDL
jgi:hypothetical protein